MQIYYKFASTDLPHEHDILSGRLLHGQVELGDVLRDAHRPQFGLVVMAVYQRVQDLLHNPPDPGVVNQRHAEQRLQEGRGKGVHHQRGLVLGGHLQQGLHEHGLQQHVPRLSAWEREGVSN